MAKRHERAQVATQEASGAVSGSPELGQEAVPERLLVLARRLQQKLDQLHEPATKPGFDLKDRPE